MCSTNVKLLSQIQWNSTSNCDCFEVRNFLWGRPLWVFAPRVSRPNCTTVDRSASGEERGSLQVLAVVTPMKGFVVLSWFSSEQFCDILLRRKTGTSLQFACRFWSSAWVANEVYNPANSVSWNNLFEMLGLWELTCLLRLLLVVATTLRYFFHPCLADPLCVTRCWLASVSCSYFFCFVCGSEGVRDLQRLTGCMLCCSVVLIFISLFVPVMYWMPFGRYTSR